MDSGQSAPFPSTVMLDMGYMYAKAPLLALKPGIDKRNKTKKDSNAVSVDFMMSRMYMQ